MIFSKALYYPTIDISDEDWLKMAYLFGGEYMKEHHRCFTIILGDVYERHRKMRDSNVSCQF